MIVIDGKAPWILELAWLVSSLAELGHEREAFIIIIITRKYLGGCPTGQCRHIPQMIRPFKSIEAQSLFITLKTKLQLTELLPLGDQLLQLS